MKASAVAALESLLESKRFHHTLVRPWDSAPVRVVPSGVPALDQVAGGWRQGEVSELVGPPTSGRTSVYVASLAAVTRTGGLAALVDGTDRFDPWAAAEAGCDLDRLLWVRGPGLTPPATPPMFTRALKQAVRACDLIVRAGGFSLVVLDVADLPPPVLRSLPLTTWLRLAKANEGQKSACVVIGQGPLARSARGMTVHLSASCRWCGTSPQSRRLVGLTADATVRASHALAGRTTFALGTERMPHAAPSIQHPALRTSTEHRAPSTEHVK